MAKKAELMNGVSKRVILVASEKGGVGKSVAARALIGQLRTEGTPVAAYDADGGVGALVRVLGTRDASGRLEPEQNATAGVGYYNVRADGERNQVLDTIGTGDSLIVHDLAGGSLADLMRIVDNGEGLEGLLATFAEHGYRVTVAHVLSPDIGSVHSVARWLDVAEDKVDHVAIRNTRWGKAETDFPYWHGFTDAKGASKGGKARERLLAMGGVEIDLPAIPAGTYAKVDAENLPFASAVSDGALTITERAHIQKFVRDFATSLDPARKLLTV